MTDTRAPLLRLFRQWIGIDKPPVCPDCEHAAYREYLGREVLCTFRVDYDDFTGLASDPVYCGCKNQAHQR